MIQPTSIQLWTTQEYSPKHADDMTVYKVALASNARWSRAARRHVEVEPYAVRKTYTCYTLEIANRIAESMHASYGLVIVDETDTATGYNARVHQPDRYQDAQKWNVQPDPTAKPETAPANRPHMVSTHGRQTSPTRQLSKRARKARRKEINARKTPN